MSVTTNEDEKTLTDEKETKFTAKNLSKLFKVFSVLGLVTCAILKWTNVLTHGEIWEMCGLWATVYGLGAGTIDANIIIDKFVKPKNE